MTKIKLLAVIISASILAGCGDDNQVTGDPTNNFESYLTESVNRATTIKFTLLGKDASVPVPTNLFLNPEDGTLNIPSGIDTSISNPRVGMGYADGFSTSMPIYISLEGKGLASQLVSSGVRIFKLAKKLTDKTLVPTDVTELTFGVDFVAQSVAKANDGSDSTLIIVPLKPFDEKSEYMFVLTDDITDSDGNAIGTSQSYASLKTSTVDYTSGSLASAQALIRGQEKIAALKGIDTDKIVYSAWFSTQSVGDVLFSTTAKLAGYRDNLAALWKDSANPNSVDLSDAYNMTFGTPSLFSDALADDAAFTKYVADGDTATSNALRTGIETIYAAGAVSFANVNVSRGTVKLPYFLETSLSTFSTTPFESAMPSLAIISNALQNNALKGVIGAQLVAKEINPTQLNTPDEQNKLVGVDLKKPDGSPLDSSRITSQYSYVPKIKSVQDVPYILFTPSTVNADTKLVIYQHGITSAKENLYAFAANLTSQNLAVIAIDHPLHGERSLNDAVSANKDALYYLNLKALPVARDNMRQSSLDVIGLRIALGKADFTSTPLDGITISDTNVKLLGHSLGGITGFTSLATAQAASSVVPDSDNFLKFGSGAYPNAGGHIAELLFASKSFGPQIKHNLAKEADESYASYAASCTFEDAVCYNNFAAANPSDAQELEAKLIPFKVAAQTLVDTVDPYSIASSAEYFDIGNVFPTMLVQSDGDETVPNNGYYEQNPNSTPLSPTAIFVGTEALATKLGLTSITGSSNTTYTGTRPFIQFNGVATHSTLLGPKIGNADLAHLQETRKTVASFLENDSLTPAVTNTDTLE
ncbi:lipase [Vibrio sp. S9_S30]|uniref:VolA/Pla-1 family phospholipase n=1 Tax=Vibrio sp. S9_S30 TaxID=2720226 RepID=UPI001680459A|nr:VolA/Pla-1 family phospholipase [Vibrio sp. S9_S30]MBD1558996.1 lipase [Vibrio sp. S9_S30]